jgi:hypothetical protein
MGMKKKLRGKLELARETLVIIRAGESEVGASGGCTLTGGSQVSDICQTRPPCAN